MIRILRRAILLSAMMLVSVAAMAVTDKEMDEARAIAAKAYLRYANDGSGYLDDVKATSMTQLKGSLKAKEKENLRAFEAVKVPADYASWDKEKLVEYWSSTFFQSSGLSDKGKAARGRVRKQISAMNVSAPSAPAPAPEPVPEATTPDPATTSAAEATPAADAPAADQQDILADQQAISEDADKNAPPTQQEDGNTVVYVIILVVLVAVVIWLVVYAANVMKKQQQPRSESRSKEDASEISSLREKAKEALTKKNEEIDDLRRRLEMEEGRSSEIGAELERYKLDNKRLLAQIEKLRGDLLAASEARNPLPRREEPRYEELRREEPRRVEPRREEPRREERRKAVAEERPIIHEIYLGRANSRGIFVRADRRLSPGNTIYRLDTNDGLVGTFYVADDPEVVELALSNPNEYLAPGCSGDNLEDTIGVSAIVTESDGTAIFENGYWKVLRKCRIRYE